MAEIEIPGVDQSVDTSEPVGAVKTFAFLAVGFMILVLGAKYGQKLATKTEEVTGVDTDEVVPEF